MDLDNLYGTPKPPKLSFLARLGKLLASKMVMSVAVSAVVAALFQMGYLRVFVALACKIILFIVGNPDPPEPLKDKFRKAEAVIKGEEEPGDKPTIKEKIVAVAHKAEEKIEKKVEPVKTAVVEAKEKAEEKVDELKDKADQVAEKLMGQRQVPPGPVDPLQTGPREGIFAPPRVTSAGMAPPPSLMERAAEGARDAQRHTAEFVANARRTQMLSAAQSLRIPTEGRTDEEISADVMKARGEIILRTAPNGSCPGCGIGIRVPTSGSQRYHCKNPRCRASFSGRQARHAGPPPGTPLYKGVRR